MRIITAFALSLVAASCTPSSGTLTLGSQCETTSVCAAGLVCMQNRCTSVEGAGAFSVANVTRDQNNLRITGSGLSAVTSATLTHAVTKEVLTLAIGQAQASEITAALPATVASWVKGSTAGVQATLILKDATGASATREVSMLVGETGPQGPQGIQGPEGPAGPAATDAATLGGHPASDFLQARQYQRTVSIPVHSVFSATAGAIYEEGFGFHPDTARSFHFTWVAPLDYVPGTPFLVRMYLRVNNFTATCGQVIGANSPQRYRVNTASGTLGASASAQSTSDSVVNVTNGNGQRSTLVIAPTGGSADFQAEDFLKLSFYRSSADGSDTCSASTLAGLTIEYTAQL